MTNRLIAVACALSFGDFVIAHAAMNSIEEPSKNRVRLIACRHLRGLNAILPAGVEVTLMESGEDRVPALFDVRKCGALAAARSALSLRRNFRAVARGENEDLAFHALGIRERLIAGRWPVIAPRTRQPNIYATYRQFLAEQSIRSLDAPVLRIGNARVIGLFPESRLVEKRLSAATLATIAAHGERVGLQTRVFVLDGDRANYGAPAAMVKTPRNFASLADAIRSVDVVISADSLPGHLAEYLGRPAFVALPRPNTYWLPHACFTRTRWGVFNQAAEFSASLYGFMEEARAA